MGKCADCKNCNKKGIPILLTRYAVAPVEAKAPNADTEIWATMGEEQDLMTPDKPPEDDQTCKCGNIYLGHSAHYTRRLLRSGYVYLFDEKRNTWHAWMVTDLGYYVWFNPKVFDDDKGLDPEDERAPDQKDVYCEHAADVPRLSCITIPGEAKDIGALWIAFSDVKWTKEVFKQHQFSAFRGKHMRKFDFKRWMGGSHPHAKKISELGEVVAEYSANGYRGCIDFHFSNSVFNFRRLKMRDVLSGKTGLSPVSSESDEYKALTNVRQAYKDFLLPPPVKPAIPKEVENLLGDEKGISDFTYDIRVLGVGYPGVTVAEDKKAARMIPYIKANCEAEKKHLIETLTDKTFFSNGAIFTLDDPAGITSDLAHLAHLRVESYSLSRLHDDEYKRQTSCSAGILRIKDAVDQQNLDKIDKGELPNPPGNQRVIDYLRKNKIPPMKVVSGDPLLRDTLNALRYPTTEEKEDILKKQWKEYDEEYKESDRVGFIKQEESKKITYDLNYVKPLLDAYLRWLDSYRLARYMECNFDDQDIASGITYTSVVSGIVADIQAHKEGEGHLTKALASPAGWDSANFLLRALAHNQKKAIEVLEISRKKLAELEDLGFNKATQKQMDNIEFRLRVSVKLAEYETDALKTVKSVPEFKTALDALSAKVKTDDSSVGQAAATLAIWNSTISAFFNVLYNSDNPVISKLKPGERHNVLSRLLTQYTGALFDVFTRGAVTRSVELQRLCTLVGAVNKTPVTRVVRHLSQSQALAEVLRYLDDNLTRAGQKGRAATLPKGHWTRQIRKELFELHANSQRAKINAAHLKKFSEADKKLILRFANSADLPDELRQTLKTVTGSEFFELEDSKAMRRMATVVMIDRNEFKVPDKDTQEKLRAQLKVLDGPDSSPFAKQKARDNINRIGKGLIQGIHVHDPNTIAFTIDANGNWQQQAVQRAASQHLEDELGRMASRTADRIQGTFTACGALAQAVGIAAAIQLIRDGNGKPGEGWSKLMAGYMGMVGLVFERATALLEAGKPLKGMTKMLSRFSENTIKFVGKALGAVAGAIMVLWDVVSAVDTFIKGRIGLTFLYAVSAGLGVCSVIAIIASAALPVVLVLVALALAVAILIMIFTPDPYEEWLFRCYYGKTKGDKFGSMNEEMIELKNVFEPEKKEEKKEQYIGGHVNPIG